MSSAVLSPGSYSSHFLSGSLYVLVAALALGYAFVLLVVGALDRYAVEPEASADRSRIVALIAGNRWFWIPPLYVLALVIVAIVTHSRGSDAAQLMYRNF